MPKERNKRVLRRDFLKKTAAFSLFAAGAGPSFLFPERAYAAGKKLRILQWKHPVPGFDRWFDGVFAKEWGQKHDTKVIVDHLAIEKISQHAAAEVAARRGHDLVMFLSPPAAYENEVIDHHEIYRELRHHWGETIELAHKSTFNPRTKRYFAFSDSYIPAPFNWLRDLWTEAGLPLGPIDYETLRRVGNRIREDRGIPCGFGLAEELSSNITLHSVLGSFGGMVQDEHGQVALNSRKTVEALKYMKALFEETEMPDVLHWESSSNAKALLAGKISCTMSNISISREAERKKRLTSDAIMLSPALRAHSDPVAPPHITQCYVIWSFAQNKEGAKQFLADLVANSLAAFHASESCNFPCFPKTVPDLLDRLSRDPKAVPQGKYLVLRDTLFWTRNIGHPGYATAAIDETFSTFVIPRMFAKVAKGELRPEEAAQEAERETRSIFAKWGQAG